MGVGSWSFPINSYSTMQLISHKYSGGSPEEEPPEEPKKKKKKSIFKRFISWVRKKKQILFYNLKR